jgi:hypothetical protein
VLPYAAIVMVGQAQIMGYQPETFSIVMKLFR